MALRNFGNALLHVSYIAGAIWIGAHELALHNITDSDVYKGPIESPVAYPLDAPVVPSVEPLQQFTSISTIFDAPTITTTMTEYITVTRDNGPTPVPTFHELSSRNPYANNSFVLGAIPYVVPFFKSSYGQALTHILSSLSTHPVTKAIYQATASLLSFLLYLWSILPGGKQGLNTLVLALFLYALQFAYVWNPLARWFSRFFRRRGNKSPPSHDSGPSPPPSPPSSGRPGGDDNDSRPASPKSPKETSSTGTQTTPGSTQSAETQTTDLVTEGERSCLNEVARLQAQLEILRKEVAQSNADIGTRDIIIADRNITIDQYKNERESDAQDHRREIDRLQAQINAAASSSEAESDEIKRFKEAHEAQIRTLQTNHDSTVQNLESEVQRLQTENDDLRHNNERLQNEKSALSQQSESSSGTAENTNSAEERQRLEHQVRDLQEEVRSLTAAQEQQQKLSLEAQTEQETALADSKHMVEALESTRTGLTQQNEALLEQERAARQAEEKAKADAEALQKKVDSLEHSHSLARAGNEAAAGSQQEIADARKREGELQARVNDLQQRLSEAEAARNAAVRQQQDDAATAQRLRESEEQLTRRISNLEQGLLQAENVHAADLKQQQEKNEAAAVQKDEALDTLTAALQKANDDNINLQHELSEVQEKNRTILEQGQELLEANQTMRKQGQELLEANETMRKQGQDLLKEQQELQTVRDQYAALNERYEKEGGALQRDYESLKQAYNEQAQKCADEKSVLEAQAQKILQYEKQNCEGLRKSIKDLKATVNQKEEENSRARDKISALQNEVKMQRWANDNLITTNNNLANRDAPNLSAADAAQNTNNTPSPSKDTPMENTNPTVQPTPFTNPPVFLPPGASPVNSTTQSPGVRKILTAHGPRSRSPKKGTYGESKDPAQEILDWCNDIPGDNTTSTSGLANLPTETPRSTPGQSPVRPIFDLQSSRPSGLNVFETVNGPTRQVNTDFTNGALSNAPALQPNHNFATGAAGHAQNPSALGTPLDPALGGTAPSITSGAASTPMLTRDQERAIHNARDIEFRQQLQHEERKKESERAYMEILRNELGNFDGQYEGDDPPDAAQTSATNGNGDTDMAGAPPSRLVVGSRQEHDYLRSMPDNENGRHDALYRRHNYRAPDTLDEFESPIYYSDFVQGSDAEISFLHSTMPANQDGRFDDLYRGNNYKVPDSWDDFDNPVWY
ncbi:hypothetical protein KCU81_g4314, partial [Aureobasidium melanogenum]|uniref:Uncharacterized protein n=1 Tax=Aureobasidium melanogenum (strain CBS 110374) TaxID=1043003 RepID=A0A074WJV1_AURM1